VFSSGTPRPHAPNFNVGEMSLPGSPVRKTNHTNIEMGGVGAGPGGGELMGFEITGICNRFLKFDFPLFVPGYGHQNVQASIFYNTVGDGGCYKQ
jgi:hypothetical protein